MRSSFFLASCGDYPFAAFLEPRYHQCCLEFVDEQVVQRAQEQDQQRQKNQSEEG